jgi:hypothetical protein
MTVSALRQARLIAVTAGAIVMLGTAVVPAQTTTFTYQGKLTDGGGAATGVFDFQFRLFDAAVSGMQVGPMLSHDDVPVANGVFTVPLDFGPAAFAGPNRFLEIAVRAGASTGGFTHLAPLHALTAAPYSIRSVAAGTADNLSAACSGCVTTAALAGGSVTNATIADVAGAKITGAVPVAAIPAGSANYIQNGTTQQGSANFNISGNGTAAGTLSAGDFSYIKAQTAFYAVSEASFTSRDGVAVSKATGLGGAYPIASTVYGLVAPVNLPHGATITNVRFVYIDNSTSSLSLIVFAHSMTGGFYSVVATHNTTVQTTVVQNVSVAASWIVDNNAQSLEIAAFPTGGWSDGAMQIRGVVITYTMLRPAR